MNQILHSLLFRLIALLLGVQEEMTQRTNALQDHAHGNLLEDDKIIMIGFYMQEEKPTPCCQS